MALLSAKTQFVSFLCTKNESQGKAKESISNQVQNRTDGCRNNVTHAPHAANGRKYEEKDLFHHSVTQAYLEKNLSSLNRNRTYDLAISRPDVLPLSCREPSVRRMIIAPKTMVRKYS